MGYGSSEAASVYRHTYFSQFCLFLMSFVTRKKSKKFLVFT